MKQTNIAIFVSGSGTNCENIIRYFQDKNHAQVVLVVSNRADAFALVRASRLGVPTRVINKKELTDEQLVMSVMREFKVDFVVLAGFLLMIPEYLIKAFPRRMVNLHPALLPEFGGKGMWGHHVHEAVKAAGKNVTGMTVHYVSEVCDGGEIIAQYSTPILPEDTPDDIAAKEHVLEMKYFPQVIDSLIQ